MRFVVSSYHNFFNILLIVCHSVFSLFISGGSVRAGFNCIYPSFIRCLPGFFGDAKQRDCRDCGCDAHGSITNICDATTGQCTCQENHEGPKCDRCKVEERGKDVIRCVHASQYEGLSVRPSVGRSVRPSIRPSCVFLNRGNHVKTA